MQINDKYVYTRLVIYKDGHKVDFVLYSVDMLRELASQEKLPLEYNLGYKVLLDKDGLTKTMKPLADKCYEIPKTTQQEFENTIKSFFFESWHVAVYLKRDDLWHARFRDWSTKEYLLKMIEWHEKAKHGFDYNVSYLGKRMKDWVDADTWKSLQKTFGRFDAKDSFDALLATTDLFRCLATQTAKALNYKYLDELDKNITGFIKKIQQRS
jgi:aminoglycoside 6-adenylyltransferase